MDDWTHPYPAVDPPSPQPMLLDQLWGAVEDRLCPADAEADAQAETTRVAELKQVQARDGFGDPRADSDVQLPLAAPPGAPLTL